MKKLIALLSYVAAIMSQQAVASGSIGPKGQVLFAMFGKKACDAAIPDFADRTRISYEGWLSRRKEIIKELEKEVSAEELRSRIEQAAAKAFPASASKGEIDAYCNEVARWLENDK